MITVLTEKPSVGKDIAKFLGANTPKSGYMEGNGYYVSWAFGHLLELKSFEEHGFNNIWSVNNLPFIPEKLSLKIKDKKGIKEQLETIKKLFDSSSEIICATDAGREGELIFRYIYQFTESSKTIKRLWISSFSTEALTDGFNNLKPSLNYDKLFESAKQRNEADYIVGINATIGITAKAASGNLISMGRVQTPTLSIIVKRFLENKNFVKKTYYGLDLILSDSKENTYHAVFEKNFDTKDQVLEIIKSLEKQLQVENKEVKEIKEEAPSLYDLTLLQREANTRYGFSAQKTLDIAQSLYETHKVITYPRTSSCYLSDDFKNKIHPLFLKVKEYHQEKSIIDRLLGLPVSLKPINSKKVTDHHAIIPTGVPPLFTSFNNDEQIIFTMIVNRFLEAFSEPCFKESIKVIFNSKVGNFISNNTTIKSLGWKNLKNGSSDSEAEQENLELDNIENNLSLLNIGDILKIVETKDFEKFTKPLPILTESSLLGLMETAGKLIENKDLVEALKEGGLGTPATRASIIETLIKRSYIVRDKKKLVPTEIGINLYHLVKDLSIASPELTGEWELKLAKIEKGDYNPLDFKTGIKNYTHDLIGVIKKMEIKNLGVEIGNCPLCAGDIAENTKAFSCSNSKDNNCLFPPIWKNIGGKNISINEVKDLLQFSKTKLIKGFKNKEGKSFDGVLIYNKEENKIKYDFPDKKLIGKCPKCEKGDLIETEKSFGCNEYKNGCDFSIWKNISNKKITDRNIQDLLKKNRTELIKGFKAKSGKAFDAFLILGKENHKISFEFKK